MTRAWVGGGALFALSIAAAGCGGSGTTQDAGLGGGGGTAQGQGGQASGGSLGSAGAAGGGHPGSGGAGGQLATGGAAGAGGGLGGGGSGVNCTGKQTLVEGTKNLLDVFVAQAGVIVVDNASVSLIGRDATVLRSVPFTRQITAAAFDGTTLVIADTAKLTVLSPALDVGPTATLVATCADAVLLGGNDLVCAPNGDTGRIYATYDVSTNPPTYLTNSGGYLYEGTPMFPVPGTTEFVTVTLEKAPASFELFQVASTGLRDVERQLAVRQLRGDSDPRVRRNAGDPHDPATGRHPRDHGERLPGRKLRLLPADGRARNAADRPELHRDDG